MFYNASMEACIVICQTKKPLSHKGQILLINAVNEVTRKKCRAIWNRHIKKNRKQHIKGLKQMVLFLVSIRRLKKMIFSESNYISL